MLVRSVHAALHATPIIVCAGFRLSMTVTALRAIPRIIPANGCLFGIVSGLTGLAVPITVRTSRVKGMRFVALRAVPMRIAV